MASGALYFPYIRVPETPWFTRVLLYWETAASIVPRALFDDREILGTRTSELVAAKLVRLISPDDFMSYRPEFSEDFLRVVASDPALDKRREAFGRGESKRIHTGKADWMLLDGLREHGVAGPPEGPEWEGWWEVEAQVAELYMACLASLLARSPELGMDPVTDAEQQLHAFRLTVEAEANDEDDAQVRRVREYERRKTDARTEILTLTLPAPAEPVSVKELARFKERHGSLLSGFRAHVEDKVLQIAKEKDAVVRRDLKRNITDQFTADLEELEARMRETKWKTDRLGSTISITTPVGGAAAAIIAGNPWAAPIALPLVGLALWRTFRERAKLEQLGLPLAYAAAASKSFRGGS